MGLQYTGTSGSGESKIRYANQRDGLGFKTRYFKPESRLNKRLGNGLDLYPKQPYLIG